MVRSSFGVIPASSGASGRAWITRFDSAMAATGSGALEGLRFAVKDNIDVRGVPTTAACPTFSRVPEHSATVVTRLLNSGATLLGKTNLDQFACGLNGTRSPYGAVPNAFDPAYISGGSSSGSAYLVATGAVDFALGTDTAGSGRVPAGLNNIVGIKPSKGLISAYGVLPAAQSVDCVSIFARTVGVAVRVLGAAMGYDARDPYSRKLALATQPFSRQFRFGVPDTLEFFGDALAEKAFQNSLQRMAALGGVAVTVPYGPLADAATLLYERGFLTSTRPTSSSPCAASLPRGGNSLLRMCLLHKHSCVPWASRRKPCGMALTSCCCPRHPRTTRLRTCWRTPLCSTETWAPIPTL